MRNFFTHLFYNWSDDSCWSCQAIECFRLNAIRITRNGLLTSRFYWPKIVLGGCPFHSLNYLRGIQTETRTSSKEGKFLLWMSDSHLKVFFHPLSLTGEAHPSTSFWRSDDRSSELISRSDHLTAKLIQKSDHLPVKPFPMIDHLTAKLIHLSDHLTAQMMSTAELSPAV